MEKLSISTCNSGWFAIEQSAPFASERRFEIGQFLRSLDDRGRFVPANRGASVEYYQLEEVVFDGQTAAVFKGLKHIAETRYSTPDGYGFAIDRTRVSSIEDARCVFLAFHAWHANYFHWITQCVPAIYWGRVMGAGAPPVFALPRLADWQEEALSLAGLADIERCGIDEHHQYEAGKLAYTTITQGATTSRPSHACVEVFDAMRLRAAGNHSAKNEAVDASEKDIRAIYVSRADAVSRQMTNETELCESLQSEGVRIVVPGQHSVDEQIAIFAESDVVIGPHGAGLTNIAFCAPGATLYELLPSSRLNPCYAVLAQSRQLHYWAEAYTSPAEETGVDSWAVDVDEVVQTARILMSRGRSL